MTIRRALPGTWFAPKNIVLLAAGGGAASTLAPHLPQNLLFAGTSEPQVGHIFPGIRISQAEAYQTLATAPTLSGPCCASQGSKCSRAPRTRSEGSRRRRASRGARFAGSASGPEAPAAARRRASARAAAARTAGVGSVA